LFVSIGKKIILSFSSGYFSSSIFSKPFMNDRKIYNLSQGFFWQKHPGKEKIE